VNGLVRLVGPSVLLLAAAIVLVMPAAIALTPPQETTVAGQYVEVGAVTPSGGWLGDLGDVFGGWPWTWPAAIADGSRGPARLEQIGDTTVDLQQVQVRGPLRPQLELGPLVRTRAAEQLLDPREGPAARDRAVRAVTEAFRDWYVWATVLLVAMTIALVTLVISVRIWAVLARASRSHAHLTVGEVWRRHSRRLRVAALVTLVGTLVVWLGVGALVSRDAGAGMAGVRSLRDLVGAAPVSLTRAGPPVEGYTGAVIGDSRASRLGGPLVADPGPDDVACERSSDSLAAQLDRLSPQDRVLNLACPSATVDRGLLRSQYRDGRTVPPQVARLLSVRNLRFVGVMIGPNDLAWSDFLRYCYGFAECDDRFVEAQFDYRLAKFDRDYGDLLAALAALPGKPQVIVVTSYDVFSLDADCADTQVEGRPGLDADSVALLAHRNAEFNDVLAAGAQAYGFTVATPHLATLCQPGDPEVGRDLQGLEDPYPFHPTGIGMVRLAATVLAAIDPGPSSPGGSA
jgi:hypothetical protein